MNLDPTVGVEPRDQPYHANVVFAKSLQLSAGYIYWVDMQLHDYMWQKISNWIKILPKHSWSAPGHLIFSREFGLFSVRQALVESS